MTALHAPCAFRPLLVPALGMLLGGIAGCDEAQHPPDAMTLLQAASNPDGDAQQAGAAFAPSKLHEPFHLLFFGDRLADEAPQPPAAGAARGSR